MKQFLKNYPFLTLGLVPYLLLGCGGTSGNSSGRLDATQQALSLDWQRVGLLTPAAVTFQLQLLGSVSSPTVGGRVLAADDIFTSGTTAYISYNLGGDTLSGSIDQVTNVNSVPVLAASVGFPTTKINGLFRNGSDLFAVGASSGADGPAVIKKFNVADPLLPSSLIATLSQAIGSYAGVGVIQRGTSIYALAGDDAINGGLSVYDSSLVRSSFTALRDARGIAYSSLNTGNMYVVAAQPGRIVEVTTAGTVVQTIALGGAATPESKSTISVGKTMMIASIGEGGAKVVCRADGHILASISAPVVAGLSPGLTVTNAVAAGQGLFFAANGEAGIYVYSMKDSAPTGSVCNTVTLSVLGSIPLGSGLSANNLKFVDGTLYVANGLGGFKLISVVSTPSVGDNTDFN
ncbi:MAG: hypothetical protein H7333_11140 [Bdellovibrionales bacterium]|nr:hypothetical protein [Oligoflexia bacterium]